jgi:hypothetical protein
LLAYQHFSKKAPEKRILFLQRKKIFSTFALAKTKVDSGAQQMSVPLSDCR